MATMVRRPPVCKIVELKVPTNHGEAVQQVVFGPEATFLGVILTGLPPAIYKFGTHVRLPLPVSRPATSMSFRRSLLPHPDNPGAKLKRNAEVAMALGAGSDGVKRFDLTLNSELAELPACDVCTVAYSSDGDLLAAGTTDGAVLVWRVARKPELVHQTQAGRQRITWMQFSASNDALYVLNTPGHCLKLPLSQESELASDVTAELLAHSNTEFYSVGCHPDDSDLLALGGVGRMAYAVDLDQPHVYPLETSLGSYLREVQFLPNGSQLAIVGELGVEVRDMEGFEVVRDLELPAGKALACRQYGGYLYVACS